MLFGVSVDLGTKLHMEGCHGDELLLDGHHMGITT